ncbi:MAG: group II truncated hemoglobin [Alphaproteobacteria bacterium]|nr:group II truncated hemoglobin [Alphaproteobacteria bacterium]
MELSYFERLGGEPGVRALVDAFYDLMDSLPEAATVRAMHPEDLSSSREKLFLFLCGWTGGPQLYIQRYGHPRLRARHFPFRIDDEAATQWMLCMESALDECVPDDGFRDQLARAFQRLAGHMRNQGPGPGGSYTR